MIEWVVAPLAVVLAFWLPGALVLTLGGARLHAVDLAAVAPAVTIGMFALTAEVIRPLGVRWGLPAAFAVTVVAGAAALAVRRRAGRASGESPPLRRDRPALLAAVGLAVALQVVVVSKGFGDPRRLLAANDIGAHMTWLRGVVDTGQASALTLTGIGRLDGVPRGLYPAGWHAVAALAVPAGGLAATFTWAWLLPSVVAWTCGVVALTRAAFRHRPAILPWVALLTGPGVALPLTLTLTPEGMVPNSVGAALVPGVLALLVARKRVCRSVAGRTLLGAVALGGLVLVHPNAFLSLVLLATGWWCPWVVRRVRRLWSERGRGWGLAMTTGFGIVAVAATAALSRVPQVRGILAAHDEGALSPVAAIGGLVTLDPTLQTAGWGVLVFVLGIAGAVVVWRRQGRPMAIGALVMVTFFLAASSALPVLSWLDAPWYDESRRYASVVVAGVLPVAAYGGHATFRLLASRVPTNTRWLMRVAVPAVVALTVLLPGSINLAQLVAKSYDGGLTGPPIAGDAELALLARLPRELSGGAVLSGPFSGGSSLYALSGYPTVPPLEWGTAIPPELRDLVARFHGLGTDPQVCADLRALGVRYLYVDPSPWQQWKALPLDPLLAAPPATGVRLVDSAGNVRVYEITACG